MAPALWLPLSLLCLCTSASLVAHSGATATTDEQVNYVVMPTSWLEPDRVCLGFRVDPSPNVTSSWVPLSHSHGPCSAASDRSSPKPVDVLLQDERRAAYIQRKLSGEDDNVTVSPCDVSDSDHTPAIPTGLGSSGTPPAPPPAKRSDQLMALEEPAATGGQRALPGVKQTMVLDTASDVAWVQCAPCRAPQCYPQTDVLYDPSRSSTYSPLPCSSPTCRNLGPYANGCTPTGQCQYRVVYPDGRSTMGTYISDTLTLNPTSPITGFQFGCSNAVQGHFPNTTAGIMSLGRGAQSLAMQTKATYGDVFSYCLPRSPSYKGFFNLGVPRVSASRYVLTPMFSVRWAPMLYVVRLQAIVVAGQLLSVPPAVFAPGSVVDSRAVITRLPPTAYMALRSAFRDRMRAYRPAPPKNQLDTCYDFRGVGSITLPKITLVFDHSAAVDLDTSAILFDGCLAFTPNSDDRAPGTIGNVLLQTYEVLYNAKGATMGFRRGAC